MSVTIRASYVGEQDKPTATTHKTFPSLNQRHNTMTSAYDPPAQAHASRRNEPLRVASHDLEVSCSRAAVARGCFVGMHFQQHPLHWLFFSSLHHTAASKTSTTTMGDRRSQSLDTSHHAHVLYTMLCVKVLFHRIPELYL